ncbi:MAG TPA: hypothetical protein VGC34_15405 [Steroidobacteraceae bacterium]
MRIRFASAFMSIALAFYISGVAGQAHAVSSGPTEALRKEYKLDIRAQPLGSALAEFARQTGLQVAGLSDSMKAG